MSVLHKRYKLLVLPVESKQQNHRVEFTDLYSSKRSVFYMEEEHWYAATSCAFNRAPGCQLSAILAGTLCSLFPDSHQDPSGHTPLPSDHASQINHPASGLRQLYPERGPNITIQSHSYHAHDSIHSTPNPLLSTYNEIYQICTKLFTFALSCAGMPLSSAIFCSTAFNNSRSRWSSSSAGALAAVRALCSTVVLDHETEPQMFLLRSLAENQVRNQISIAMHETPAALAQPLRKRALVLVHRLLLGY